MRKWVRRRVLAVAVILLCAATLTATAQSLEDDMEEWLSVGEYFRMVNEAGEVIMESGRVLGEGDEYLTSENDLYRVVRVDADQRIAYAEYVGKVDLRVVPFGELLQSAGRALAGMVDTEPRGLIGVYHTHNAESYVPTDGTDSIYGQGGIHQVGRPRGQSPERE